MIKKRITDEDMAILDRISHEVSESGHKINGLHNCRNGQSTYILSIPVLLKHLEINYSNIVKEEIIQAFADKKAYDLSYSKLYSIYFSLNRHDIESENKTYSRYFNTLAWSLSEMMGKSDLNDMIKIIYNKNLGGSRIFFVRRMLRFKFDRKQEIIDFMLSDPDLYKETAARLKIKKARH